MKTIGAALGVVLAVVVLLVFASLACLGAWLGLGKQ
jgi:hypothetical protein